MVTQLAGGPVDCAWLLADAVSRADKLPPTTRAALMMALLGIALVGLMFIVAILLGGHWVRRQGTFRRGPSVPPDRAPLASPPAAAHTAEVPSPGKAASDDRPAAGDTLSDANRHGDDTLHE